MALLYKPIENLILKLCQIYYSTVNLVMPVFSAFRFMRIYSSVETYFFFDFEFDPMHILPLDVSKLLKELFASMLSDDLRTATAMRTK